MKTRQARGTPRGAVATVSGCAKTSLRFLPGGPGSLCAGGGRPKCHLTGDAWHECAPSDTDARALRPCSPRPQPHAGAATHLSKVSGSGRGASASARLGLAGAPCLRVPSQATSPRPHADLHRARRTSGPGPFDSQRCYCPWPWTLSPLDITSLHHTRANRPVKGDGVRAGVACRSLGAEIWQPPWMGRAHPKAVQTTGTLVGHGPCAPVRLALRGRVLPSDAARLDEGPGGCGVRDCDVRGGHRELEQRAIRGRGRSRSGQ